MSALAITVLGHDRPGIIAEVTEALVDLGGNLEDSSMTLLRGHFAMTLVVRTEATVGAVQAALSGLEHDGLRVFVLQVPDEDGRAEVGDRYLLSVHGADRVGIVAAITAVVAAHGANIVDLTTRLGRNLYVLTAEVDVPRTGDPSSLTDGLQRVAHEIGLEISLLPVDDDLI
jgi:glycine cleavage system transcriptional repressor